MYSAEEKENIIKDAMEKAIALFNIGSFAKSKEIFIEILKIERSNVLALMGRANCHKEIALQWEKDSDRSSAKKAQFEWDYAVKYNNYAIQAEPENWEPLNNLGMIFMAKCNALNAAKYFEKSMSLDLTKVEPQFHLAVCYDVLNWFEKAQEIYEAIIICVPDADFAYLGMSYSLLKMNKVNEAKIWLEKILELKPDFPKAHFNLGICHAFNNEWEKAYEQFEWKWGVFKSYRHDKKEKEWNGEDLKGKRLLCYSDQAGGDLIQFSRYLKIIKEMSATVIVETGAELIELFKNMEFVDECNLNLTTENYDWHVACTSLPLKLKHFEKMSDVVPYIKPVILPKHDKVMEDIFQCNKFKIGITWAGSVTHGNDHNRSCFLKEFEGIYKLYNLQMFSFQKYLTQSTKESRMVRHFPFRGRFNLIEGCSDWFIGDNKGRQIINLDDHLHDFSDTAAILSKMDLVITVDTAIAHVAGAMNIPTWLILPFNPCWRWGLDSDKTDWYPSVRIFRQNTTSKWKNVFQEMEDVLRVMLKEC